MKGFQLERRMGTYGYTFAEPKPKFCCQNLQQTISMYDRCRADPAGKFGSGGDFSTVWWLSLNRGFTTVREMKTTPL